MVWLLMNSTWAEAEAAALAAGVGVVIHFAYKLYSKS
jgi:hypothetical protein